jgi:hypothetical protein
MPPAAKEVSAAAEEQSASTEDMASSASELLDASSRLSKLVEGFRTWRLDCCPTGASPAFRRMRLGLGFRLRLNRPDPSLRFSTRR